VEVALLGLPGDGLGHELLELGRPDQLVAASSLLQDGALLISLAHSGGVLGRDLALVRRSLLLLPGLALARSDPGLHLGRHRGVVPLECPVDLLDLLWPVLLGEGGHVPLLGRRLHSVLSSESDKVRMLVRCLE
jgi:hypothetical protein